MGNPVTHFEVMGSDAGKLREFYAGAFGWAVQHDPEAGDPFDYSMISTQSGGEALQGGIGRTPDGTAALTFYIQVPDLEDALARVEASGGATVQGRLKVGPETSIAKFTDPEGNVVGLVEG